VENNGRMTKFHSDWKTIAIVIGTGLAMWIFGLYSQEAADGIFSQSTFWKATLIAVIPITLGILLATRYSYAAVSEHTLTYVYLLFYRRTIDIRDITEINDDQPTYKMAKSSFRSVYIFFTRPRKKKRNISNSA
jgi:hypothetical protein